VIRGGKVRRKKGVVKRFFFTSKINRLQSQFRERVEAGRRFAFVTRVTGWIDVPLP
jgi:hypothetical protein